MKQNLHIDFTWLNEEYELWKEECDDLTFAEWLYQEFLHGPAVGAILGVNGFSTPLNKENIEEYYSMDKDEQTKELASRFDCFYAEVAKMLGLSIESIQNDLNL